jgi:hypothetical protein
MKVDRVSHHVFPYTMEGADVCPCIHRVMSHQLMAPFQDFGNTALLHSIYPYGMRK